MINRKFGKDLTLVVLSNGVRLFSSILTVFFIPMIFPQQDYGFYKLFLLYISYVGIFHFGFIDGIYLHFAGKDFSELDKKDFRLYTKALFTVELFVSLIVIVISLFLTGERQFITFLAGVNLIVLNLTTYFQYISQITQRFKEFATRNIIYTVMNVILIGSFYLFEITDYRLYIVLTIIINSVLLLWYVVTYREIVFGKSSKAIDNIDSLLYILKIGVILLFSNLVVMFFSSIPTQYVDFKYPVEVYPNIFANFSFAYTLLGFTGVFMSAISLVLYPSLNKSRSEEVIKSYNGLVAFVLGSISMLIIAYFPMTYIVQVYLPDYYDSLEIFYVLAPGITLTSAVTVVIHNYYKTLKMNKEFFIIGLVNLLLLIAGIYLVNTFISQKIIYISITTVAVQFIWYLILNHQMNKKFGNRSYKNLLYIIFSSVTFYFTAAIENLLLGFLIYGFIIITITLLIYFIEIKNIVNLILTKMKNRKTQV